MGTTADYDVTDAPAAGTALTTYAPSTALESIDAVRAAIAKLDDDEITAACLGVVARTWMYRIPFKKKGGGVEYVDGISASGAVQIARIRAQSGFPLKHPTMPSAEECTQNGAAGIRVSCLMRDSRTGHEAVGVIFEPYVVNGRVNEFPDRKALSKARRNAILDLIPEDQALAILKAARAAADQPRAAAPRQAAAPRAVAAPRAEVKAVGAAASALPRDPYNNPVEEPPVTPEQLTAIDKLLQNPACMTMKGTVMQRLEAGEYNTARAAASCIAGLNGMINAAKKNPSTGAPSTDASELALAGERRTRDAVRDGGR